MKKRAWLILGLFFLWGAGSTYWYVCKIKGFCNEQEKIANTQKEEEKPQENLEQKEEQIPQDIIYFDKNSSKPVINDQAGWTAEIKSLKDRQEEGKKLFIYGPYYAWEKTPEGYENLGMARAESLKQLLAKDIDTANILTRSRLLQNNEELSYISGTDGVFEWHTHNDYVKEETPGNAVVYFPYNSNKEIKVKAIVVYLDDLAEKLKKDPGMKVQITGHTDNTGSEASNMKLSKKRAERIKNILVNKGVPAGQIIVIAKGESEPVADNSTEEGRKQNRRVEIKIIK